MKRCSICDCLYDDSLSFVSFFDDICQECEEIILNSLLEFEDEVKEEKDETG